MPQGPLRITRVTDPTVACTVVAASELGGASLGAGRPQTREGGLTVTWRNVDTAQGRKQLVTCEVDTTANAVTSIKADGVELLEQPQPI